MSGLIHPIRIGSCQLANNLALAPMAGTSDLAYRRICSRMGAGLTVTELVSARGMLHDPEFKRNWRFLALDPQSGPTAVQLFGSDPADFASAIAMIAGHPVLAQCSMIDLNMGCPVRKVVGTGAGSALMQNPGLAGRIVAAAVEAASCRGWPVTVKFRSGWDEQSINAPAFARVLERSGASALTLHARTRQQMYGGQADWNMIAAVKQAVSIPVYGNGDIATPEDAARLVAQTGADGIMIGRAALGNPWIFRQILDRYAQPDPEANQERTAGLMATGRPTADDVVSVVMMHLDGLAGLIGEHQAIREMRRHLPAYLRGTRHASAWRSRAMMLACRQDLLDLLDEWRICCRKSCENS